MNIERDARKMKVEKILESWLTFDIILHCHQECISKQSFKSINISRNWVRNLSQNLNITHIKNNFKKIYIKIQISRQLCIRNIQHLWTQKSVLPPSTIPPVNYRLLSTNVYSAVGSGPNDWILWSDWVRQAHSFNQSGVFFSCQLGNGGDYICLVRNTLILQQFTKTVPLLVIIKQGLQKKQKCKNNS